MNYLKEKTGSAAHGNFQARILEWVAISYSRGYSQSRDPTHISCISRKILYHCATWEAPRRVLVAVNSLEGLGRGECLWNLSQSSICIKEACFFLKLHWKLVVMALKWLMINGRGQCQSPSLLPSVYKFFTCTNNKHEFKMKTRVGRIERVALKYICYYL